MTFSPPYTILNVKNPGSLERRCALMASLLIKNARCIVSCDDQDIGNENPANFKF